MKKVFSLEKYINFYRSIGTPEELIGISDSSWPKKCEGLTKEEIHKMKLGVVDSWMIEVEEEEDNKVTLDVEIDTKQIDETIEKLEKLNTMSQKSTDVNVIVDGLIKNVADYIEMNMIDGVCDPADMARLIDALANLLKARGN